MTACCRGSDAAEYCTTHSQTRSINGHACTSLYGICFASRELNLYCGEVILLLDLLHTTFALNNTCSARTCFVEVWQALANTVYQQQVTCEQ